MAKILVDQKTRKLIPDFIDQVKKIVGKVLVINSSVYGVKELLFKYKKFKENEVVLARVTKSTETEKLEVTSINSTEKYYIHYQ